MVEGLVFVGVFEFWAKGFSVTKWTCRLMVPMSTHWCWMPLRVAVILFDCKSTHALHPDRKGRTVSAG